MPQMVEKEKGSATLFSSEIGRLTPAAIMVYRTGDTINIRSRQFGMRLMSRIALLLINVFLLGCLLVTEYGSGSRPIFEVIRANVTDVRKHSGLVAAIAKDVLPTSALTPLGLAPQDYSYSSNQSSIMLKRRVRPLEDPIANVRMKDADQQSKRVSICGISSASAECKTFFGNADRTMTSPGTGDRPKFFQVGNVTKISALFEDAPKHLYFARGIREIGEGVMLYTNPKNHTMDCVVEEYVVLRSDYKSYQLNICASNAGRFVLFFFLEEMHGAFVDSLLRSNPGLKNNSAVHYSSGRMYRNSIFGIDRNSIPSTEVALYQLLRMDAKLYRYKKRLGQSENIFMDYLKERMLWALLGAVQGNSAIESVEVQATVRFAT